MSEVSERVMASASEKRGNKEYWKREALRLADEVVALETERDEFKARAASYHEGMVNRTKIIGQLETKLEAAETGMIGEDAQPLPEWEWYFDLKEEQEK